MCSSLGAERARKREAIADLERQICELAADLAAATCRWLLLIAEFDALEGWAEPGALSCAHWLSYRLGIGLRTARDHVRVARALTGLPLITERFTSGQLSYSKVRALTRVAQPETEADLVMMAEHATGAQIERLCGGYGSVIRATRERAELAEEKQCLSCTWDEDGMLRVSGRLTAEDGALLLSALQSAEERDPSRTAPSRRARALMALVTGEKRAGDAEVIVHVDVATLSSEQITERCEVENGPSIAPEVARRLGCDGALVTIVERDGEPLSVGRRTRAINPALRRALRSRDPGCRFPGCENTRHLHAHHIEHWARGGATELGNLIHLCTHHHRMVHEGGYDVKLDREGRPHFYNSGGFEIPETGEMVPTGVPLGWQNESLGIRVDADTARPRSAGDPLDYDLALMGLASQWLPEAPRPRPG